MTSKHTPGPWRVEYKETWPFDILVAPNVVAMRRVASSTSHKNIEDLRCAEGFDDCDAVAKAVAEQEANARLIAAAPDMLEALKAAVDCGMIPKSSAKDGGASRYARQVHVADMIRAAIAKAEGDE